MCVPGRQCIMLLYKKYVAYAWTSWIMYGTLCVEEQKFQIECHPYLSNAKLIEFCKMRHIVTTAYSPLGSSDNPFVSRTPDELLVNDPVLRELGKKYNKTAAQVALRWNLQRGVSVIPKSVTPSRIKENFDITDFDIEEKDMELISGLNKNYRTCAAPILAKSKYFPFNIEF